MNCQFSGKSRLGVSEIKTSFLQKNIIDTYKEKCCIWFKYTSSWDRKGHNFNKKTSENRCDRNFKLLQLFQPITKQQIFGRNFSHIVSRILQKADFSYWIRNDKILNRILLRFWFKLLGQQLTIAIDLKLSIIEYPSHCHKIDFIIFSSFCVCFFKLLLLIFFFIIKKKMQMSWPEKRWCFFLGRGGSIGEHMFLNFANHEDSC